MSQMMSRQGCGLAIEYGWWELIDAVLQCASAPTARKTTIATVAKERSIPWQTSSLPSFRLAPTCTAEALQADATGHRLLARVAI
ncbi:hypothetical protein CBOM_07577 [Ceraceosorus bombacis]|uniref:Uncharacterized protein n=1 Tax=Ceraceosorus bombacis TaxID=401625 RepID=A0A0P1BFV1_9BASI|nr:hypothetical protein CBOM_07577 [Ceraceosorus bombacis]